MNNLSYEVHQHMPLFIEHDKEGSHFTVPFTMPPDVETFSLSYSYERHHEEQIRVERGSFTARKEINVIDLGLIAPDGTQVGASGAARTVILVGETLASPGYQPRKLTPGQWQIIVGAYRVAEAGVEVSYELVFQLKHLRWFKGDLHTHTINSDGDLTLEELAQHAHSNGLDFLAVTDHNQAISVATLREHAHIRLIPGMEWTHPKGHANFLGYRSFDEPYIANTIEEARSRFETARANGALIVINHPKDGLNPFLFDIDQLPFDCLEIWKGLIVEYNPIAIAWWQSLLVAGRKLPVCGGSDYHEDSLNRFPGGPTTCVYALSNSPSDILSALKQGHAFITFAPYGPTLEMSAGEAILGDSVQFSKVKQLEYIARGLTAGDVVQVITNRATTPVIQAESSGDMHGSYTMEAPGFARIEILRSYLPTLPMLPALVSNPIYFDP